MLIAGVAILLIAVVLIALEKKGHGRTKGAGVIIVGPIPIVFGSDKESVKMMLALSIALVAALIILTVLSRI